MKEIRGSLHTYLYSDKSETSFESFLKREFFIVTDNDKVETKIADLKKDEFLEVTYSSENEKERSQIAIRDNLTLFKEEDVSYRVNRLGIRTSGIDLVKDYTHTLMAGDSFTFGEGIPYKMTWPYLISKKYNCSFENLGYPGASISKIARILTTILPIKKPKRVVVLFPTSGRQELVIDAPPSSNDRDYYTINYQAGFPPKEGTFRQPCIDYEKSLTSHVDKLDMYKNFYIIKLLADSLGIELVVSSWDTEVYKELFNVFDESQIAGHFHYLARDKKNDKARDGMHPGENPNIIFADAIERAIGKRKQKDR